MISACHLGELLGMVDPETRERIHALLTRIGLPTSIPDLDGDALLTAMAGDKKARAGVVHFILPTGIGQVERRPLDDMRLVREAVDRTR